MPISRPINPKDGLPFNMEFYYAGVIGGPEKTINFKFTPTYSAKKLLVNVVQPAQSTNYKSNPPPRGDSNTSGGLTVNRYEITDIAVGKPVTLDISYTRAANGPSITGSGNQGGQPSKGLSLTGSRSTVIIGILMVGILVALFFVGSKPRTAARAGRSARVEPVTGNRPKTERRTSTASRSTAIGSRANTQHGSIEEEKKRARSLLLDGRISEETYKEIILDLEGSGKEPRRGR